MHDFHTPVLLQEVVEQLHIEKGKKYIDATLGGGGYCIEILKRGGKVLGIDLDPEAIHYVQEKIKNQRLKIKNKENLILVRGNFRDSKDIAHSYGFDNVSGVVFDLGLSSYQLEKSGRGFSFLKDEPLDMRMGPSAHSGLSTSGRSDSEESSDSKRSKTDGSGLTAAAIVNTWRKEELYELFSKMGEERFALPIAEHIARARKIKPIETSSELAGLVAEEVKGVQGRHPATKVFMALRIAVNNEIENLRIGLVSGIDLLEKKGRVAVVSFHSLEDRVVKNVFRSFEKNGIVEILTKKPIVADFAEVKRNPRARSAKLRVAQKREV